MTATPPASWIQRSVAQGGPAVRHVARVAFGEKAAEDLAGVAAHPGLHQVPGEVRARDQLGVAHIAQCAFVGAPDAHLGQLARDLLRPLAASAARGRQALGQLRIVGVEPQADDMYRGVGKGDGDLHPSQVVHAQGVGGGHGAVLAADLVVVGQGPQLHTIAMRSGG